MARELAPHLERYDALVLGPGLGRSPGAAAFLAALPSPLPRPAVVDADALFWLASKRSLRKLLPPDCILTPHPGEAGRLAKASTRDIQAHRLGQARALGDLNCNQTFSTFERVGTVNDNLNVVGGGGIFSYQELE